MNRKEFGQLTSSLHIEEKIEKLEGQLAGKMSKNVGLVLLLFLGIAFAGFYSYNKYKEFYSRTLSLTNRINELETRLDSDKIRLQFISKADSIVTDCKSSDLDTAERVIYLNSVWNHSKEFNVNPYLVLSTNIVESGLKKKARSKAGAIGLAQFLPSTFRLCHAMIGNKTEMPDMYDIDTQIRYQCFYMRLLYDDCDNWGIAMSRYNQGFTNDVNLYAIKVLKLKDSLSK